MKNTRHLFITSYIERRQRRRRIFAVLACVALLCALSAQLFLESAY